MRIFSYKAPRKISGYERKGLTAEGLDDLYMLHTRYVILLPEHQNIFRNNAIHNLGKNNCLRCFNIVCSTLNLIFTVIRENMIR